MTGDIEELYEHAPCGFLTTTADGVITRVNATFEAQTGHPRERLVGSCLTDLLTAGGRIYHETHYAPMLRMQGSAREIALDLVRADGTRLPVLLSSVLERGVVRTAVFDARDRREYERELLREKQRAEESEGRARALARTLQQTLIPPTPPVVPGLDVAAVYRPAGSGDEVGGDFYDVFQIGDGDWVVALGDVCGKGVDAAVVTALARYTLRAAAVRFPKPAQALGMLNDVLLRSETERFCTVALLRLCQGDHGWTAALSVGGHPLPLLLPPGGEPAAFGKPGSLVGAFEGATYEDVEVALHPGDTVVLYTDGVTEARAGDAFYGGEGLDRSVRTHAGPAATLAEGILADVLVFQGGDARDDIAVVVARVPGS